jgi:hypothetical protein
MLLKEGNKKLTVVVGLGNLVPGVSDRPAPVEVFTA